MKLARTATDLHRLATLGRRTNESMAAAIRRIGKREGFACYTVEAACAGHRA